MRVFPMFESLGQFLGLSGHSPAEVALWLGAAIGLAFGALARATGFCFRAAVVGTPDGRGGGRGRARAMWLLALAAAVAGTQAAIAAGLVDFTGHRFVAPALPLAGMVIGGVLFGAGMVLARGCVSRLTVLAAGGNLRAVVALVVVASVALAAMRGALAPLRQALAGPLVDMGGVLPGPGLAWAAALAVLAGVLAWRAGLRPGVALAGLAIGLLVPATYVGTGFVLFDDFDPIPMEALSFTAPVGDALFWFGAATGVPARFGTGLVGGVLAGAFLIALLRREARWEGFDGGTIQTGRSVAGAALMGFGGVLAGGCTVGAGLSGIATLGLAGMIAVAAMVAGAQAAALGLRRRAVAV